LRVAAAQLGLGLEPAPRALPVLDQQEHRGAEFLELPVRRVLNPPASTHMPFWSLNPYVGCEFGCSYCYARKTHEWTLERHEAGGEAPASIPHSGRRAEAELLTPHDAFERRILIKQNAPDVLIRTLEPARVRGAAILIGSATDPYQPAEKRFGLTRRLLEALLLHRGLHFGIITKSPLIVRDIPLLKAVAERHELSIHLSIASTDAALLRRLEARTPAPHARLRALHRLTSAGLRAGVMIAPILPGITDGWSALAALMEQAKEAGAHWAIGAALRLGAAARAGFLPTLRREFPELVARYERGYGRSQRAGKDYERALARRICLLQEAYGFPVREGYSRHAPTRGQ
jgi:DNA repair photolyase